MSERPKCNVAGCKVLAKLHGYHRKGMSYYAMCGRHLKLAQKEIEKNDTSEKQFKI